MWLVGDVILLVALVSLSLFTTCLCIRYFMNDKKFYAYHQGQDNHRVLWEPLGDADLETEHSLAGTTVVVSYIMKSYKSVRLIATNRSEYSSYFRLRDHFTPFAGDGTPLLLPNKLIRIPAKSTRVLVLQTGVPVDSMDVE